MIVNQWVPAAHRGDAIGDSARRVRDLLRRMGHTSDLYALTIDDELRDDVRPFGHEDARRGDATIFHFALPSPMTHAFATLDGRRILQYHNITPAHFFAPYDPMLFRLAALGRRELATLAGSVDLALGDSDYNRQELETLGFEPTGVMPIAISTGRIRNAPRQRVLESLLEDGLVNVLFVGRIVPNKKIEDLIRLAETFKRYIDIHYRFVFVGRYDGMPRYHAALRSLIDAYDMPRERFIFTGPVPEEELATYYRTATVYVSLSEHEGFCVPLIEAMIADVPVLAYAAGAVPETLGGAGVLVQSKDFEMMAELLGVLAFDERVRARVLEGQRRRLLDFSDERIVGDLTRILDVAQGSSPALPN